VLYAGVFTSGGTGIQMAAHWDINSPCAGTQPEAGKNLSVCEALNLEKAKNKKRKTKSEKRKSKSWKRGIENKICFYMREDRNKNVIKSYQKKVGHHAWPCVIINTLTNC
jgi:hypothetical protein